MFPLLRLRLSNLPNLPQHPMVQNHPIQPPKALNRQVHGFRREREVGQVAVQHLDLLAVLLLELLEGFEAAGNDDDVVGLGGVEEVFCDGEADAWFGVWVSGFVWSWEWVVCLYLERRR